MVWMITVYKGFVKSFLAGEKDIELRTRVPKALRPGDIIVVAQSGTHNKVVLQMSVLSVIKLGPGEMFAKYWRGIQVNYLAYHEYTRKHEWVYGIRVKDVVKMEGELHTSDFGIDKAPQWFREVKETKKVLDYLRDKTRESTSLGTLG